MRKFEYTPPAAARRLEAQLQRVIGEAVWNDYQSRVVMDDKSYVCRFAGDCESPYLRWTICPPRRGEAKTHWKWVDELPEWEFPDFKEVRTWMGGSPLEEGLSARFYHRCRKCRACRQWRRMMWIARASEEMCRSVRTWMCTFTFTDAAFAHLSLPSRPLDYERIALGHGQRYLRALRRQGFSLRYLLVTEFGENTGRVHLHALIHSSNLKQRPLDAAWTHGHSHVRLVRIGKRGYLHAAEYVAKYLTKSLGSRIRASLKYGLSPLEDSPPHSKSARPAKGGACIQGLQTAGDPLAEAKPKPKPFAAHER